MRPAAGLRLLNADQGWTQEEGWTEALETRATLIDKEDIL